MSLDRVPPGRDVANDCNVIIEIPMRADRIFEHDEDLEPGKWVRLGAWVGAEAAKRGILEAIERYEHASPRPGF